MKKSLLIFSALIVSTASLPALAHTPGWLSIKHPEFKRMEQLRAQANVRTPAAQPVAMQEGSDGSGDSPSLLQEQANWYDVKHPEEKTMDRMRAQAEARSRAKLAMHDTGTHHG